MRRLFALYLVLVAFGAGSAPVAAAGESKVVTLRVPHGGNAPQVAVDENGVAHLIYFKAARGDLGDVFYVRTADGGATFSPPVRVNSQPNSAGAARVPRVAVGPGGRVHVVWNGSTGALPKGRPNPAMPADSPYNGTPVLYARLNDDGTAFEPQRNLMRKTFTLDGGASVAADGDGNVYAVWHAAAEGLPDGERGRRVWVAKSADGGKTFGEEVLAWDKPVGACGCCHVRAYAEKGGAVYVLFRAAESALDRDTYLLVSRDGAKTFTGAEVDPWRTPVCPMSSMTLARTPAGVVAGWETDGRVLFGTLAGDGAVVNGRDEPAPGSRGRKYPEVATNAAGESIRVWTEGMGWKKGGAVAWQVYDRDGRPTDAKGRQDGVPADGAAAVFPRPDGSFAIVY
jgi:hypothetical protein